MPSAETIDVDLNRRVTPVGRCIYCGATRDEARLTLEHVIPFALAGRLELPDASCDACAKIINSGFEQEYLSGEVIDVRAFLKLPSRSTKKRIGRGAPHERPGRVGVLTPAGDFERWQSVGRDDFPYALWFPEYGVPAFVTGQPALPALPLINQHTYIAPDYEAKMARMAGAVTFGTFEPSVLAREIAKIAHGIVVAELGLDGFDPFLVPLILGQDPLLNRYFGGTGARLRSSDLHAATITRRPDGILLVRVCLFASLGAPTFMVVAGRARPQANSEPGAAPPVAA